MSYVSAKEIADAIDNLADAVRGHPNTTALIGVRERELELDRRVGAAVMTLLERGAELIEFKCVRGRWIVKAKRPDGHGFHGGRGDGFVDNIERAAHAARNWPR